VFLAVVRAHADAATREALTQLLFNLIKKPNAAQRRTIMDGYAASTLRTMGFSWTGSECRAYWRIALAMTGGISRVRDNSAVGCAESPL
jgi:hypothetical protein